MIDYPSMGHKVNLCNFFLHKLFYTPAQHADKEEPILMEIKLYQALHDAKKLQERVQALKALPKRLSPEALRIIRFWDKEVVHA